MVAEGLKLTIICTYSYFLIDQSVLCILVKLLLRIDVNVVGPQFFPDLQKTQVISETSQQTHMYFLIPVDTKKVNHEFLLDKSLSVSHTRTLYNTKM